MARKLSKPLYPNLPRTHTDAFKTMQIYKGSTSMYYKAIIALLRK